MHPVTTVEPSADDPVEFDCVTGLLTGNSDPQHCTEDREMEEEAAAAGSSTIRCHVVLLQKQPRWSNDTMQHQWSKQRIRIQEE